MAEEPDVTIEKVPLTEANINPCRGCNACEKLNKCIQRDGMDTCHDKIIEADCIVLSSPIFCMGLASQVKALVDRAQVFRSRKYVLKLPVVPPERKGKRMGVFLATAGQTWPHVFEAAVPSVKCFYHVIEIKDARYPVPDDKRRGRERCDRTPPYGQERCRGPREILSLPN